MESNRENKIKLACPHCDESIEFEEEMAGTAAECPSCGKQLIVPHLASPPDGQVGPEGKQGEGSAAGEFASEVASGVFSEVWGCVCLVVFLGLVVLIIAAIRSCAG